MNILVPTDFSRYSKYALNIAAQIAQNKNASLHLYHSADVPDNWEHLPLEDKIKDQLNTFIVIDAKAKLSSQLSTIESIKIPKDSHYKGGEFIDNIQEAVSEIGIDLIVMGSKGASDRKGVFMGSNSQKVIRQVRKNTIVIKSPIKVFDPKKVVFVTSLSKKDQKGFKSFLNFLESYEPTEVHILVIDLSNWFLQPDIVIREALKDFEKIAKDYNCTSHFYKDYSIQSGIRHFVKEFKIDFVGISYSSRNPIKRLFMGSNVEVLVNRSNLPVLCINESP